MSSAKHDRRRGQKDDSLPAREAQVLIEQMHADLDAIKACLETLADQVEAPPAKRVARLRLMSEDLASARKFAAKLGRD